MGRLLEALLHDSEVAPAAIPAIPAIPRPREGARIAESQKSQRAEVEKTEIGVMRAHLLELAKLERLPADLVHHLHDDDLRAIPEDFTERNLTAYLRELLAAREMDAGAIPESWGGAIEATCEGCGPVYLWPGAPVRLKACPWCFRRKAGKTIPRPRVKCGDCLHYQPDPINPAAGMGACSLGAARAYWPTKLHHCADIRPLKYQGDNKQ